MDSQGNFTPEGRHDILVEALGRPEHPGRVHAVGQGVGIKEYFGAARSHLSSSPKESKEELKNRLREELMEEMRKETERMNGELRQELSQQLCGELPIQTLVSPAPKSTKGSCAVPTTSGDDMMGQTRQCELLVDGGMIPQVVAIGKVYEEATTLHNVPLPSDVAKVTVERVRVPDAHVPLPSEEVTTVADAFQSFVAWPRHLIRVMPEPPVIISFHMVIYIYILHLIYNQCSFICRNLVGNQVRERSMRFRLTIL